METGLQFVMGEDMLPVFSGETNCSLAAFNGQVYCICERKLLYYTNLDFLNSLNLERQYIMRINSSQMAPTPFVRARWRMRLWVQDPQGACVTYQLKKGSTSQAAGFLFTRNTLLHSRLKYLLP
jgi:hypothetical protein